MTNTTTPAALASSDTTVSTITSPSKSGAAACLRESGMASIWRIASKTASQNC